MSGRPLFELSTQMLAQAWLRVEKQFPLIGAGEVGFGRAEALAAFVNGLVMLGVVTWIVTEAIHRLSAAELVQGGAVMLVATIGLIINIIVAWVLSHDKESVNTRAREPTCMLNFAPPNINCQQN